jgi:hypothetical protein
MSDLWIQRALQQRTNNIKAIAKAHVDAGDYGTGWLKVDALGNLTRVNPRDITIVLKKGETK